MKKIIVISGTPGTGKTTLANELSLLFKKEAINISNFAKKHSILEEFDEKRDTFEVSEEKLVEKLTEEIEKSEDLMFIEGHMSHFLPKNRVKLCIICKCELKELKKRLEKRKYSETKVKENLECEIFDICLNEAIEKNHNIEILDCTKIDKKTIDSIKKIIEKYN